MLEQCVGSLRKHAGACDIVVVDNASDDGSLNFLTSDPGNERVLKNAENLGFAGANNMGWRSGSGDDVLFLNPDAFCAEGAVQLLSDTLSREPGAAAIAGMLCDLSGTPQAGFNIRTLPTVAAVASELLLLDEIWPGNPWSARYRMLGQDYSNIREVEQPAAACLMVRREMLEQIGGFDESFFPAWFEDVDLCKRIRDAGGRILFQPAARFTHVGGSSLRRLSREEFLVHYHSNQIRYFEKHLGQAAAARVRGLVLAGLRLRAAISILAPADPTLGRAACRRSFSRAAARIAGTTGRNA